MSAADLAKSLSGLEQGLSSYIHDVALEGGEFVVYLRKPTFSEKLMMVVMPKRMERERLAVAISVIREAANKIGIDGDRMVGSIMDGHGSEVRRELRDAAVKASFRNRDHQDLV